MLSMEYSTPMNVNKHDSLLEGMPINFPMRGEGATIKKIGKLLTYHGSGKDGKILKFCYF